MDGEVPRILVVDDEAGMREGCRRILLTEGYEVETAEDGLDALELFAKGNGRFSVALVDLKMPRMGGLELIEKLHERDEDIVLLVITAYATINTAVEATKRGAYGYIPKPFTPDELLLPVKNGLDRRALSIEAKRLRQERERRLLEVAIERSKCNTIINCMTDGVLVVNRDRQIVLRNAAAARIIPGDSVLQLPADLDSLESDQLLSLIADTLSSSGEPVICSKEICLEDSTYMVNASPVLEPNGETLGAVAVLRDITAIKKLETAKSLFVSMVAHEIKSPLAAIEGYLNVILSGAAGDDPARDRRMMERSLLRARALRTMVSELMDLTAMETGNFTIKRSLIDIAEVVRETVESCRSDAAEKDIELTMQYQPEMGASRVLADRDAICGVFRNLIDNSIKYTPAEGHVKVGVEQNGIHVKVTVSDDGIGMDPEDKARVFEEFFRARNESTAEIPGTGLGLSVVKRLVDMHHGKVSVRSTLGEGSTFTVSLPTEE